ncbi:acyl carrier protein [Dactylosporangium sp. CA-052675]|uniref:acyl carrier protein n=1 Tax=Dactylosporangium sp. CA-052675 TaxID=3239927 RepID=UPI003D8FB51E
MSDVEAGVYEIVGRVLGSREWTPKSDFFDVGGSSLGAIQIVGMVEERFGVRVSLTDFFDAPDLETFAALVVERH